MSINTLNKTSIAQFLSSTAMGLSISLMAISAAHAEQYCKSVDKDGNATYTLAPDKGCNAKKMKTVAINHHITPNAPAAPKPTVAKTNSTEAAPSTTPTPTETPAVTPAAPTSPIGAAPNADASKLQQTPNR